VDVLNRGINSLTFLVVVVVLVVVVDLVVAVVVVTVVVVRIVVVVVCLAVETRSDCCWNLKGEVLVVKEFSGQFSLLLSLVSGTLNSRPLTPG